MNFILALLLMLSSAQASTNVTFEKKQIRLAGKTIKVEIADTYERRQQGLMNRTKLAETDGMLFIFDEEQTLGFWMKNTLIPLAIGYFDKDKKLVDIHEMVPAGFAELNPRTYQSRKQAMFALEMTKGWFTRNKVEIGTRFSYLP